VILAVSVTNVTGQFISTIIYIQRHQNANTSYSVLIGIFIDLICGSAVAFTRLCHPKVRAKLKEICGYTESLPEYLIADDDEEKEEILKSILHLTVDGAADDIADMFEHLGHKILVQILVLLTLRFREDREKEQSLTDAIREFRRTREQKHYAIMNYIELASEMKLPFLDQIYCPDVSLIEFESGIFRCIMRSAGFDKKLMLE
jgi:hypothetical protein